MQLVEVAVVAAIRKAGVQLNRIRSAREYCAKVLESEFPFAEFRFMTDGKELLIDFEQVAGAEHSDKFLSASGKGQLSWKIVKGRLKEFDYEEGGIAIRWHVAGKNSPVMIDPQISFGAPTVFGTPTWAIRGRWESGESLNDIVEDFSIPEKQVRGALVFEGIKPDQSRQDLWAN